MAVFRIDRYAATEAARNVVRQRIAVLTRAKRRPARADARRLRLLETSLAIVLGAVLWLNSWMGLGPIDIPSATPPPREASTTVPLAEGRNNPFLTTAAAAAPPAEDAGGLVAESSLSLTLHGTWVDASGGAAIIQTSEQNQDRFVPGDTIIPGVILDTVMRDHVIIVSNGVRESLRLINRDTPMAGGEPSGRPLQAVTEGMAQIGNFITAKPQPDGVGNLSLVLMPAADLEVFESLGLRAGDRLVGVDNQTLGPDIAEGLELISMTAGAASVTLSVEREGVVMPITVSLSGGGRIE